MYGLTWRQLQRLNRKKQINNIKDAILLTLSLILVILMLIGAYSITQMNIVQ
jgi:hypothetical protein